MPAPQLLPPISELRQLVEAGLTHQQIVDHIQRTMGIRVARSSVSAALSRAGLTRDVMRYKEELPWRVKGEHLTQYPARMLRLLGRRRAEIELTDDEDARLDAWISSLDERGLIVAYCPDGDGFIYVDADEVEDGAAGIPIRRRTITLDEVET